MKRSAQTQEVLIKGKDYEITPEGWWIFSKSYLLNRGFCCLNACKNCPYSLKDKESKESFCIK